jgi:hypothetical protein
MGHMKMLSSIAAILLSAGWLTGCSESAEDTPVAAAEPLRAEAVAMTAPARNPNRNAYFGDVHVHTLFSVDAYLFGTRNTPDDAYRFAKGEAITHAAGVTMQMKKPLDFQAVTDHGFYLGVLPALVESSGPMSEHPLVAAARNIETPADSRAGFAAMVEHLVGRAQHADQPDPLLQPEISARAWQEIIAAAERHNDPGTFTTLVGYEYTTSGPVRENLHRNVLFRDANVPALPFTRLDSPNPEDLWAWMDANREAGIESLAIPHNSNASDGLMFDLVMFDGGPLDAEYAATRMRNEPLVEQTQVKGTSDTHPLLSPNDEWADFEIMPIKVANPGLSRPEGSYVRDAYRRGLQIQEVDGFNPYRFGLIGSSDTHNAAGSFEEDNYWSKTGVSDITAQQRGSVPLTDPSTSEVADDDPMASGESGIAPDGRVYAPAAARYWGASGLAGVCAESNTRADIYDAMRRKETFSTSGQHIQVRFFGSLEYDASLLEVDDVIAAAYARGVPMGGELSRGSGAPSFFVWASRDADSVALQRLQVIKAWVADGDSHEQVFDIACADGGSVDPATHRCPDNGAGVDIATCAVTPDKGSAELQTLWSDPTFDPGQRAVYYARVLENPKCRWSTWDAIRAGVKPRVDMAATIQDRAWSSPIWYSP